MFLPRDGSALVSGGSILGRAHGGLPARTSTLSLVVEPESDHKKIRDGSRKSWKLRKFLSPTSGGSTQIRTQEISRSLPLIPEMPIIPASARELNVLSGPNGAMSSGNCWNCANPENPDEMGIGEGAKPPAATCANLRKSTSAHDCE